MISRRAVFLQLVILGLSLCAGLGESAHAQGQGKRCQAFAGKDKGPRPSPASEAAQKSNTPLASWEVEAWGSDKKEAEQNGLEKARQLVIAHLQSEAPFLMWKPDVDYIRTNLVK